MNKVISWLEGLTFDDWSKYHSDSEVRNIAKAALELLKWYKEHEHDVCVNCPVGTDYTEIIRCKDCKHRPTKPDDYENGFDLEFPDGKCPCQCEDEWYSRYPPDDWFCANGENDTITT